MVFIPPYTNMRGKKCIVCGKAEQLPDKRRCASCRYKSRAEYNKQWKANLTDKQKLKLKQYRKERWAKYYAKHKKELSKKRKEYRTNNKQKCRAIEYISRLSDPDKYKQIRKKSYEKNKHKYSSDRRKQLIKDHYIKNKEAIIIRQYMVRKLGVGVPLGEIRRRLKYYKKMHEKLKQ